MTFTLIILTVTFLAAVWIAFDLLRPRAPRSARLRAGQGAPSQGSSAASSYDPVARLLKQEDFDFVAEHADLAHRLRDSRDATMRLYLRQIRGEFLEIWDVCRLLAPISPDPAFASRLTRQYWSFHCAYASAYAQCLMPAMMPKSAAADRLVAALSDLRDQARDLLAASDALAAPSAA